MIYRNLCLIFSHISFCFYTCAFQCASASFALFSFHFSCSLSFSSLLLCNPASFHLSHLIRYFNFRFFNYYFSLTLSFPLPTPILNLTLGILPFQNMSSFCLVIMLETNKSTPVITFVAFYFLISLFLFFFFFFSEQILSCQKASLFSSLAFLTSLLFVMSHHYLVQNRQ